MPRYPYNSPRFRICGTETGPRGTLAARSSRRHGAGAAERAVGSRLRHHDQAALWPPGGGGCELQPEEAGSSLARLARMLHEGLDFVFWRVVWFSSARFREVGRWLMARRVRVERRRRTLSVLFEPRGRREAQRAAPGPDSRSFSGTRPRGPTLSGGEPVHQEPEHGLVGTGAG